MDSIFFLIETKSEFALSAITRWIEAIECTILIVRLSFVHVHDSRW